MASLYRRAVALTLPVFRSADMNAPESVQASLAGVDDLLLISGSEVGGRTRQHKDMGGRRGEPSLLTRTAAGGRGSQP